MDLNEGYEATLWGCPPRINMIYDYEDDLIVLVPTDDEDLDHMEAAIAFPACHALEIVDNMKKMVEKALEVKEAIKVGAKEGLTPEEVTNTFEDPLWVEVAEEIVQRAARGEVVQCSLQS